MSDEPKCGPCADGRPCADHPRPPVSDQTPTPERRWTCEKPGWMGACSPSSTHHNGFDWGCGWIYPAAPPAPTPEPPLSIADSDDPSPWADHPPTPSPVSPEDGDEPATWADLLTCERCGRPLEQPGALMFSPPNKAGMVRKHHICADCYLAGEGFTAASGAVS